MALFGPTFQLTGHKHLDKVFQTLPVRVQKKVLRKPLRDAAKIIHAQAKANAPVRTGLLRSSLKVRAGKRSRRFKNEVRIVVVTEGGFFKGKAFYGGFVELGFRRGHRRLGKVRRKVPGQHFIKRAYDQTEQRARRVAISGIAAGIIQEAKLLK